MAGLETSVEALSLGEARDFQYAKRPDQGGRLGRPIQLLLNYFQFKHNPDQVSNLYDVEIFKKFTTKEGQETTLPVDRARGLKRAVLKFAQEQHAQVFKNKLPAFDGNKLMYYPGHLFEPAKKTVTLPVTLPPKEGKEGKGGKDRAPRGPSVFELKITLARTLDRRQLQQYFDKKLPEVPQDVVQSFEVVLRESLATNSNFKLVKRAFYLDPRANGQQPGEDIQLGECAELWRGYIQHVKATVNGLALNFDVTGGCFYMPLVLTHFVGQFFQLGGPQDLQRMTFNQSQRSNLDGRLRGLTVTLLHLGMKKKIFGVTREPASRCMFPNKKKGGQEESVATYFAETYRPLQYPNLPCIQVHPDKPILLPLEVCQLTPGQSIGRKPNPEQTAAMIKLTAQRPHERARSIITGVNSTGYGNNPLVNQFGIQIGNQMYPSASRTIEPPALLYGNNRTVTPDKGAWNMKDLRVVEGRPLENWAIISFAGERFLNRGDVERFLDAFISMAKTTGLPNVAPPKVVRVGVNPREFQNELSQASTVTPPLKMIFVILPDKSASFYQDIKQMGDTRLGIVTQCLVAQNVKKANPQYCANVVLKVNVKLGGSNTFPKEPLPMFDQPTIVFGCDVGHPGVGGRTVRPSVAAVVASLDRYCSRYISRVRVQSSAKEEKVVHLKEMVKECLIDFRKANNIIPQRIIFYRDGLSEGQFSAVAGWEIDQIKLACQELDPDYSPLLSFIVVTKRHHTVMLPKTPPPQPTLQPMGALQSIWNKAVSWISHTPTTTRHIPECQVRCSA
eukprot:TRINITY_DN2485_c0_g1::TRINITY_DN2485_c0_g1_i1::g.8917::m.8917 TRINITY_DN2485_c0_g1::TRINITY_DN2485_c0_g1_i1::g.8917  ORF type:complete len:804 (+),score=230.50,sp/Q9SJK3/AGO5_ARATH/34.52/4e-115,Piwi/PF02171.12/3.4e-53,PAZ/PF02170.17/1.9e-20,DUF1785/PF08699.5/3.1e-08 TRINITY_DN2485_c0_g1_i1:50-2413(+)